MGIKIVANKRNAFCIRIHGGNVFNKVREILPRLVLEHLHHAFPDQRIHGHENIRGPASDIFRIKILNLVVISVRFTTFITQLLGHFVHADHWIRRVFRSRIDINDILHRRDESSILFWRNNPFFPQPWLNLLNF